MLQIGRDRFADFAALCADMTNIWDVEDEDIEALNEEFKGDLDAWQVLFIRSAWIMSEMAEEFGIVLRKLKQRYPMLHKRLADRARLESDQQLE